MDEAAQKAGERNVRRLLIEPLQELGLGKPTGLNNAGYEKMLEGLCQRLAYMQPEKIEALAETMAAQPGGKDKDRFPIAARVLEEAAVLDPPEASASPLMRAVFGSELGRVALAEGWAPELLREVRRTRRFPKGKFTVSQIRKQAEDSVRRMKDIQWRSDNGRALSADDVRFQDARLGAIEKCNEIRALAQSEGGK